MMRCCLLLTTLLLPLTASADAWLRVEQPSATLRAQLPAGAIDCDFHPSVPSIQALMPYADPLRDLALWFVQLWAESLGKTRPDGTFTGPTPLPALGATDQHSQVQLFMEGPRDKTVTFITVRAREGEGPIPARHGDIPELAYLRGHTLGELLDIERRATAGALAARGRFNATITLDAIDAAHVGELLQLFALATAYAGALYGINAFDQPGVELGKQFAYALLGKPGSDAARAEWDALPQPDPRWSV